MELIKFMLGYSVVLLATASGDFTHRENYILHNLLSDGENETRIRYKNLYAKETKIAYTVDDRNGLLLWQLTDGKRLIQSIYSINKELKDCEYIEDSRLIDSFTNQFQDEVDLELFSLDLGNDSFTTYKNITYLPLKHKKQLPQELQGILNYHELRSECKNLHREIQRMAHEMSSDKREEVMNELNRGRNKRSIFTITEPSTNWCGMGNKYKSDYKYGPSMGADYCCSYHDKCMFSITGLSKNYEYFNYRPYTISHCDCDERFRTCLKTTNTAPANLVGKIFFNIIQTKCFILKPHKVCSKRSWWGKCLKWQLKKKAVLRDPIPY